MKKLKIYIINGLIIFVIISLAGLSQIYHYPHLVTYVFIPIILFISLSFNKFSFYSIHNHYVKYFLGFLFVALALCLIANNMKVAIASVQTMLGAFLCIVFTMELLRYKEHDFTTLFLLAFVITFLFLSLHLLFGVKKIDISSSYDYRTNYIFDINENSYSYMSFFANIAVFYLIQLNRKKIYIILSIFCLLLGVFTSFITLSRTGFIFTLLIGFFYWIFIFDGFKVKIFTKTLIILPILCIGLLYTLHYYNNSYLKIRVNDSIKNGDTRTILVKEALAAFANHPFTGLGPSQFQLTSTDNQFSHNSFTEAAANMGILGIIFILLLFILPLVAEFKRYFHAKDKTIRKLNILFFLSFIFLNTTYVLYLDPNAMIFLFIVICISNRLITRTQLSDSISLKFYPGKVYK